MAQRQFKKPVIKRDRLPMNFPHYAIIYSLLGMIIWGYGWQFWVLLAFCIINILIYWARKSIEYTREDDK